MPVETWYVMEDGAVANPNDVRTDAGGVLRHKDGRSVAYAPHGPRSRSVNTDEVKDVKPAPAKGGYLTREMGASADGQDELPRLRGEYYAKFGKRPFHGWDAEALRAKIAAGIDVGEATDGVEAQGEDRLV